MKKLIIGVITACAIAPAFAQHHHGHRPIHHHRHWHHPHYGWVVPAIIGGAVVYSVTRPDPVIVQQPSSVFPQPVENCSPWTETQNPDGTITRTRTCVK